LGGKASYPEGKRQEVGAKVSVGVQLPAKGRRIIDM